MTIRMPPRLVQTRRVLLGEAGLALGGPLLLICFFSVRSPVSANAQECAPGKKEQKKPYRYRRPPPPPRRARDHRAVCACVSLPLLLRCRGRRLVGPGPFRPPSVRKSAFSSDPMRGRAWGRPLARPDRPMRVASAGCPSPRPVFGGGKPERFLCRPLRPAPPRSESGEEPRGARERVVTTACRARVGAWGVLPVAGNEGAACAHARVPRDPGSPAPPRVRTHLGRDAEPSGGRTGLGGGGLPGPTRPPSVPRRERSLPRFPVFAVPADRGLAARVACVRRSCCVPCGGRLAPPSPAAFPRLGRSG